MHGSPATKGPSTAESGPSPRPQNSSHNYPPPNSPPGVIHPNVQDYGPPPAVSQHQYPPPPPAPFMAHAYPPSTPVPFYRTGQRLGSAPRQRTSIACEYCHKRKIRCSGKDNTPDAQHQNRDISSSEYGANPDLTQNYYPPYSNFRHTPPDHRDGTRFSYGLWQDGPYSIKAYAAPGKSLQDFTSILNDKQARHFSDQDHKTFSNADSGVSMNSEPTINGHDVSETWKSLIQTLHGRELQAPLATPSLQLPQGLRSRSPAASPEIPQDQDKKSRNIGENSGTLLRAKFKTRYPASEESIELPDPARLIIRSPDLSSSPTISSDIDVDSISGDSEGQVDRNSRGYCVFSRAFSRLAILVQNEVTARGGSSSSNSKGKQVAKDGFGSSSGTIDTANMRGSRKNRRQGDDNGDESRDRQNEPPKKKGKASQSHCDERSQFLACPYWKADSRKYWDCFLKKNDTIAHLKQHLTRRHTPKYYCQICYQTFKEFDLFDSHALERSCTRGPSARLEGISQQQKNQLSLKSKGTVEQQLYTVWSILFPDMEPPATIYIYSTQSEDFCRIQEFVQREGVAIMLEELESNGLVVRLNASNQLLRSTVQRAMVSIFRSYSIRREPSSESEEPILIQALEPDNGVSLQQESTTEDRIGHGNLPTMSTDVNRTVEDGSDNPMIGRSNRPIRSTWTQLPIATSWFPRGVVWDDTEDELWGTAFLDEPEFGGSSPGNDLPLHFESSDTLDLDALLRDVISTEA
ncbi:hypothetical protein FPHYL_10202 [Fusarium phyllophilum]|uniref:C2H2-type domain-containing protein n=1 Tax=Fusarium phyllophilum TaxID=47803 RepID=A0A8H5N0P8_9HYPO|nr:hypothetical protein FPHYL_10202 [Fusarium phyllophilum]